jgi:hypothetical protein
LSRFFKESSVCSFKFEVDEKVDKLSLDPYNMKYMQIYVNKLKNVDAYISIAENVVDIAAREKVMPSINKNYT